MPFSDTLQPARMSRIAIVAPKPVLRDALVALADAGTVELVVPAGAPDGPEAEALRRLDRSRPSAASDAPRIARERLDPTSLEHDARRDLLAGEVELVRRSATAITHGSFAALVGWTPTESLPELDERLQAVGAAAVELPIPPFSEPPTLVVETSTRRPFQPLVSTYGVAPYANVDVTLFAGIAFVLMFSIMFGDTGHGLLLVLAGLLIRRAHRGRLASLQPMWPLFVLSGLGAALVGLLYGDALGPTGVVPRLWIDPVEDPLPLFAVALTVGIALLTVSHLFGIVNRYRESGLRAALLSPSALAGLLVLGGATAVAVGWLTSSDPAVWAGAASIAIGMILLAVGFLIAALADGGVGTAVTQALVELVDAVVRIGANILSFARLAAFGVLHSALGMAVFAAAGALWGGLLGSLLAVVVFVVGNAVTFSIELLVTTIQALRLEFYELFSRVFTAQGHAFRPWRIPVVSGSEEP